MALTVFSCLWSEASYPSWIFPIGQSWTIINTATFVWALIFPNFMWVQKSVGVILKVLFMDQLVMRLSLGALCTVVHEQWMVERLCTYEVTIIILNPAVLFFRSFIKRINVERVILLTLIYIHHIQVVSWIFLIRIVVLPENLSGKRHFYFCLCMWHFG